MSHDAMSLQDYSRNDQSPLFFTTQDEKDHKNEKNP
jgi:hypothetical protein